jgi:hypothetical protein
MATSTTSICNQALARFGARRINSYEDASDSKLEAVYCRLFFEQTAKALIRAHWWRFAKHRVALSQDTTDPAFQWSYAYLLPNDFLRAIGVYDGSNLIDGLTYESYELEGNRLLIEASSVNLKYFRWAPDVTQWDPLFIEVLVLYLAQKLVTPLSQDPKLLVTINNELMPLMRRVRALDRREQAHVGRAELKCWNDAKYTDNP